MADPKDVHRRVMMILGAFLFAMGLAAAYLAFSSGNLPSLFYGLGLSAQNAPRMERLKPDLVPWEKWSPKVFVQAKKSGRLIFLDISSRWSHASTLTDQILYADPGAAAFIQKRLIPVRIDADQRPDLLLRYPPRAWPALDILLPSGALLAEGSAMTPELFRGWSSEILSAYQKRPQAAARWARKNMEAEGGQDPRDPQFPPDIAALQRRLTAVWNPAAEGSGHAPIFPFFERIRLLEQIPSPWAQELTRQGARAALQLEDPEWGGFYRYARGPGWDHPATGKRLSEQAWALAALAHLNPRAAARTAAYVDEFLAVPAGGYAASQAADLEEPNGLLLEGGYYFSLPDKRRRALGLPRVDGRLFAAANGLMARAVLDNRPIAGAAATRQAEKTLDRWWNEGIEDGCVRHDLSNKDGLSCFLPDQTELGLAFLAGYSAERRPEDMARALALARATAKNLANPKTGALRDEPASFGLTAAGAPIFDPTLNARAFFFYRRLADALPDGSAKLEWNRRATKLEQWLERNTRAMDPPLAIFLEVGAKNGSHAPSNSQFGKIGKS
ncbi:MAG TPA: DUF255 domain-containing protein [Elusimicrobiota bacterium]|nr:DUF255 domain-containing protein [Elusimicrobiota bacterium]